MSELSNKRGFFITFEGIDSSGKTTQVKLLKDALEHVGFTVKSFRSPGTTKIGEIIRGITKDPANTNMANETELLLMCGDRAQLVHECIKPALDNGAVVLCDRYFCSTLVYQGFGREKMDQLIVKTLAHYSVIDTLPDLSFVLDITSEMECKRKIDRGTTDRFEQEDMNYQARIRQGFDWLKSMEKASNGKLIVIDANPSIEEVHTEIYRCAAFRIAQMREGSLQINDVKKLII